MKEPLASDKDILRSRLAAKSLRGTLEGRKHGDDSISDADEEKLSLVSVDDAATGTRLSFALL